MERIYNEDEKNASEYDINEEDEEDEEDEENEENEEDEENKEDKEDKEDEENEEDYDVEYDNCGEIYFNDMYHFLDFDRWPSKYKLKGNIKIDMEQYITLQKELKVINIGYNEVCINELNMKHFYGTTEKYYYIKCKFHDTIYVIEYDVYLNGNYVNDEISINSCYKLIMGDKTLKKYREYIKPNDIIKNILFMLMDQKL